jgi:hypothetical protein
MNIKLHAFLISAKTDAKNKNKKKKPDAMTAYSREKIHRYPPGSRLNGTQPDSM